jgi:hypothetical protein
LLPCLSAETTLNAPKLPIFTTLYITPEEVLLDLSQSLLQTAESIASFVIGGELDRQYVPLHIATRYRALSENDGEYAISGGATQAANQVNKTANEYLHLELTGHIIGTFTAQFYIESTRHAEQAIEYGLTCGRLC